MRTSNLTKLALAFSTILFINCKHSLTESLPANEPEGVSQGLLPVRVELSQNYPNPFNVSTAIDFQIPVSMYIRIKVYTEEWEERETLINDNFPAAYHSVRYIAPDLPSGEYYYTLEAEGVTIIRKMKCVK